MHLLGGGEGTREGKGGSEVLVTSVCPVSEHFTEPSVCLCVLFYSGRHSTEN